MNGTYVNYLAHSSRSSFVTTIICVFLSARTRHIQLMPWLSFQLPVNQVGVLAPGNYHFTWTLAQALASLLPSIFFHCRVLTV